MPDKNRAQSGFIIEVGLERENTEHQIQPARHLFDAAPIPRPDLRTDIIKNARPMFFFPEGAGQPQIESRIINQNDRVGPAVFDFLKRLLKLRPKIAVALDHFPEADDGRLVDPIVEASSHDRLHLRPAPARELHIRHDLPQGAQERRAVVVAAGLSGDEVNRLRHSRRFAW